MKLGVMTVAALAALAAVPAQAQRRMVSQGMTPAQVRGIFGAPARTRETGEWTYWFYPNGCPVRCGSDDVVFFRNGEVVTAVLRSRRRLVTGPAASTALERAGGDLDADAIRAQAGEAPPARAPERIHVNGRSRETDLQEVVPPARVGRIHVESGGRVIDRQPVGQVRDVAPAGSAPSAANGRRGVRNPVGTASDSAQGAPATAVDDSRAAREGEVRRNTVQSPPDTLQAHRTNREKSVTPRVVPRP